ncbi:Cytochrome P450 1A1 [Holothuria leucospilota]|uniref:unspecific monooxygenase n=1 Tax=Holothuria leucospilota TaxID=206669 RepID=A0A9Q1C3C2_HOLLE|nr:Cytochrome P450 1A1 [Holothuria leucospilota]
MSSSSGKAKAVPGPRGLPILGNIPQLDNELHKTCASLVDRYGDVFRIRIGSRDVVVLNGTEAIRQALVRQPLDFAGRPDLRSFRSYKNIIGDNISFTSHSPGWKIHRKLAETTLRTFTAGSKMSVLEEKVMFEVEELISCWTNNNYEEVVVDPADHVKLSVSNIMLSFIMGRRHQLDNQKLLDFVSLSDDFSKATGSGNPVDFMPWLRYIVSGTLKRYESLLHSYKNWFGSYVEDHKRNYQEGSEDDIMDYLTTSTNNMDPKELEVAEITKETLQSTVYDLFGAGFDTVSASLLWALLYLVTFPDVQKAMYDELVKVVGKDRKPSLEDRRNLPFTQAFLAETLRHSCVVPFTIPHSTTRDVVLGGKYNFYIPGDTVVFVNLHSVQHSKEQWDTPEEFDPARFLTADHSKLDSSKVEQTMPFGAGRRRCLGSELGRNELFLYVTNLVHKVRFEAYDKDSLTMEHEPGLSVRPLPFKVRLALRED